MIIDDLFFIWLQTSTFPYTKCFFFYCYYYYYMDLLTQLRLPVSYHSPPRQVGESSSIIIEGDDTNQRSVCNSSALFVF